MDENLPIFLVKSKQGRYGKKLLREAEKVRNLPMSVKCYTKEGLRKMGIGAKTASNMDKLMNESAFWTPPHNKLDSLYLKLSHE